MQSICSGISIFKVRATLVKMELCIYSSLERVMANLKKLQDLFEIKTVIFKSKSGWVLTLNKNDQWKCWYWSDK